VSIQAKIGVNAHYTRSINLERDANSTSVVQSYVPTSRVLRTLERVAETFGEVRAPRAWSLVGPYGAGKSSFAIFFAHLLSGHDKEASKVAVDVLKKADGPLGERYAALGEGGHGHCYVLLTGSPEPLGLRLTQSLADAAAAYWADKPGRSPAVVAHLRKLADQQAIKASELISAIKKLQDAIAKSGGNGLLIVIDELGKFLEYEARHEDVNDIYLLQSLAEHAYEGHKANLSLVVMLHQSFDQYAKGLGEALKNEWAKIQGRFENIPFLESTEQVLRVVASAFASKLTEVEWEKIHKSSVKVATRLEKNQALPGALDADEAAGLFTSCYPLHPLSALLLPVLCHKVAQNERTLFSYLGSLEPHGLQNSLERIKKIGDWVYPWEIYEYFIMNQPAALSDSITHRRWAEVVTAVERLGDAPDAEIQLLKAIGLLNIVGNQGGFKASKDLVGLCLETNALAKKAIQALVAKSIVHYRKFSSEYRVWQGTDFDLNLQVEEALSKLGHFNLAEQLNSRHSLLPIVARRYSIQTGTLRYFEPWFADAETFEKLTEKAGSARIVFYLANKHDDIDELQERVKGSFSDLDVVVICQQGEQLRDAVGEVLSLEKVRKSAQELNSDPVAQREYKDRYQAALSEEQRLLNSLVDNPSENRWYWQAKPLSVGSKRSLQAVLSEVLGKVYSAAPIIKNELINRDKPSSQANAARNKLVQAMLLQAETDDLGIDKFPPEKAIYRALLMVSKLHVQTPDGHWGFQGPSSKRISDDPCNFYEVWKRIEGFLDDTENAPQSFDRLTSELRSPPYGIKAGVLPMLYFAVVMAHQHELAIYENGAYTPYLSPEKVERFLRRPDEFTVQRFRVSGLNNSIFQEYSKSLYGDKKERSLLSLAKPIAKFIGDLPAYTQSTSHHLSEQAKAVRNAFRLSKSPVKLLLEDIPEALGVSVKHLQGGEEGVKKLSGALTATLRELKYCHPNMLKEMQVLLADAFGLDSNLDLVDLRKTLYGRYVGLDQYTVDREGQRAFILRLTNQQDSDEAWFKGLMIFLSHVSIEKWVDKDRDTAEYRLGELSRKLHDLEKLRIHYESMGSKLDGDFDVYLLRSIKKGAPHYDEVVAVDQHRHEAISEAKKALKKELDDVMDNELKLAVLAELVDEFLGEYRSKTITAGEKENGETLTQGEAS